VAEPIDEHFSTALRALPVPPGGPTSHPAPDGDPLTPGSPLTAAGAWEIFDAQLGSRHLDLAARELRAAGAGFYTIGSSGHEGNAAVAAVLRPTDPALLHYRSGGFYLERARQVGVGEPLRDVLLGLVAAADEPIAGGRHKVFGRHDLAVIPQTSTVASHLPRALGVAFGIGRAHRLGVDAPESGGTAAPYPADAIAVCSFGDASANHSTAVGAINAAAQFGYRGLAMPLLLVCEDNGIGISTRTPDGWIAAAYGGRPGLAYFTADGTDLPAVYAAARDAADYVRTRRRPAFLHLRTVRLMGHAGSDFEPGYRDRREISGDYDRDPVLRTARLLIESGRGTVEQVLARYEAKRERVRSLAAEAERAARLTTAEQVRAPLAAALADARAVRAAAPAGEPGATLAQTITATLHQVLAARPQAVVFGEDVARKGGVYGLTRGLAKEFGADRVFDTILDEQTILGLALGGALCGLLPIPEIQYLAYLHNALDQIRGEGATLEFFSQRRYRNPAVVRIAGYGYQKGFGGHFHNDDSVAALMDIPGILIASPAHPDDAEALLHTCVEAAATTGALSLFLEPIALYHRKDLYEPGDGGWLRGALPRPDGDTGAVGTARTHGDGTDLTVVTFGNGLAMSLRVAARLVERGVRARVVDLRWLAPLPIDHVLREARVTGRVLVVDETRRTGGVGQHVVTALVEAGYRGALARVASADSFVPLGDAAEAVLLSEDTIERAALALCGPA
jgi:2-oxoisovalerate dehydrogenase E1 component